MRRLALSALLAMLATACADSTGPSLAPAAPSPVGFAGYSTKVSGEVRDAAYRPIAGATVEITSGAQVEGPVLSRADGQFSFGETRITGGVTIRGTKEGYEPFVSTTPYIAGRSFSGTLFLAPSGRALLIEEGAYELAMNVDNACAGLPTDLRRQVFAATVTRDTDQVGTGIYFARATGPFSSFLTEFRFGVAGNYVSPWDESELWWRLPPYRYFEAGLGGGGGSFGVAIDTPTLSSASFPFGMTYCELKSEMGAGSNCFTSPPDQVIIRSNCSGRATLARQ